MAKPIVALDAVFGTVQKTANTFTNIVGTVDAGVSMLNNFVERHAIQQADKNLVERKVARIRLTEDTALQIAERRLEINHRLKDANFAGIYASALTEIEQLFTPAG